MTLSPHLIRLIRLQSQISLKREQGGLEILINIKFGDD